MRILQHVKNRLGTHDRLLAKGTSIAFAGVSINMAMGLLITFFKARLLGMDEFGMFILATSVAITTFFIAYSLPITIIRYGSLFAGEGSQAKIKSVVITVYKLALPINVSLLILLNIAAPYIANNIYNKPGLTILIHLMSFSAFFQALSSVNVGLLRSNYLIKYEYIALIGQMALVGFFALTSLIFIDPDHLLMVFAVAYPLAALIMLIYTCFVVRREFGFLFDRGVVPEAHGKRVIRFTMYVSITAGLSKFRDEINIFLIGFFLLTTDVALYGVAFKAAFLPLIITPAVNAIFTPMVGNFYGKKDIKSIKRLQLKVSVIVAAFSITMVLFYVVAASYVLAIFGPQYVAARTALLIMALGNVAAALAGPIGFSISMMGRPQYNTVNSLILLIMMVGLCYYLIPTMGINGAAIAYAVSNGFIGLLCLGEVLWLYRAESLKIAEA
jgi:O-antigen/teichoic acid export membrane protein